MVYFYRTSGYEITEVRFFYKRIKNKKQKKVKKCEMSVCHA